MPWLRNFSKSGAITGEGAGCSTDASFAGLCAAATDKNLYEAREALNTNVRILFCARRAMALRKC